MILKSLEDELDAVPLPSQPQPGQDGGVTKSASFLFEMLEKCKMNFDRKGYILDILTRLLQYFGAQTPSPRHHNGASLGKFLDFLQVCVFSKIFILYTNKNQLYYCNKKTVFTDNSISESGSGDVQHKISKISKFYKVYIKSEASRGGSGGRTLYYWCLCPGYSMQDLLAEGARCIILTSGTLSPISTFKDELKM